MLRISEFSDEDGQIEPGRITRAFSSEDMLESKVDSETQGLKKKQFGGRVNY